MTKMKERSLIKFEKSWMGARIMTIGNVEFFVMRAQAWGFGIELDPLDRTFMVRILNIIFGVAIYYGD